MKVIAHFVFSLVQTFAEALLTPEYTNPQGQEMLLLRIKEEQRRAHWYYRIPCLIVRTSRPSVFMVPALSFSCLRSPGNFRISLHKSE